MTIPEQAVEAADYSIEDLKLRAQPYFNGIEWQTDGLAAWSLAEIERLRLLVGVQRPENVARALRALVDKLDRVHADKRYECVWTVSQMHVGPYTGPTYTAELEAARASLAALPHTGQAGDAFELGYNTALALVYPAPQAGCAKEGWQLVPQEPTHDMIIAGLIAGVEQDKPYAERPEIGGEAKAALLVKSGSHYAATYKAMLTASPPPPVAESGWQEALAEFARWVIRESVFDGTSIDGGVVQQKAQKLGLIDEVGYDPAVHGQSDDAAPGDPWFVFSQSLIAESGWQEIESAPKDGSEFLGLNANAASVGYRVVYFDDEAKEPYVWHVEDAAKGFNHHRDFFTHWMPLPEPPKNA